MSTSNGHGGGHNAGNNNNGGGKKPWNNNWKKPWFNKNKNNSSNNNKKNDDTSAAAAASGSNSSYQKKRPPSANKLFDDQSLGDSENFDSEVSHAVVFDSSLREDDNIIDHIENSECEFKMWSLYFKEKFEEDSDTHKTVQHFLFLIQEWKDKFVLNKVADKHSFEVDYKDLCNSEIIQEKLPEFVNEFDQRPEFYLNCLGLAMHQYIINRYAAIAEVIRQRITDTNTNDDFGSEQTDDISFYNCTSIPAINVRILNYNKSTRIKDLTAVVYDQFISLTGTVVKISAIKPFVNRIAFECMSCDSTFQLALIEGKYQNPTRCVNKACNAKQFTQMRNHFMSQVVEWQKFKLQEVILDHSEKDNENGRIPRSIECELTEDLTDTCSPGDLVTVNGVVKALSGETVGAGKTNKEKCSFFFYVAVNSVQGVISSRSDDSSLKVSKKLEFTRKNIEFFKELQRTPNVFKTLVNSLCPSIFGHELVKAGLLLGLFGGSKKGAVAEMAIRSDPHILVVGDPGLGKSQLLRACANVSPRGVFVCGNSTTSAGLTVTLSKEAGEDFALEAGALLCAHNGTCCIDEFDKMGNQQQTLLEAMEQQCISIAKGGIVATLPCRTTVLAAANPIGGHYDKSKTVSENLKLSGPLLSRFDLLFILLDRPDKDLDFQLSGHILSLHNEKFKNHSLSTSSSFFHGLGNNSTYSSSTQNVTNQSVCNEKLGLSESDEPNDSVDSIPLAIKLRLEPGAAFDSLPSQLLRKYIMYAKTSCDPVIGKEASGVLRDFYVKLRQTNLRSKGCNPITMRQLESLIRLTQARAKCEMRKICSENDAREVVEIMKNSMIDYFEDENGDVDFSRSMNGSFSNTNASISMSSLGKIKNMKSLTTFLIDLVDERGNRELTTAELTKIILGSNMKQKVPKDCISKLNEQGFMIKNASGNYKVL